MTPARVHWTRLDRLSDPADATALLDRTEFARAARMHPRVRSRWIAGRVWVRETLGRELGLAAAAVPLRVGRFGRPVLSPSPTRAALEPARSAPTHLSISHTDTVIALAIADNPIGIDVEGRLPAGEDVFAVAATVGSAAEVAQFAALAPRDRPAAFQRWWVAKEAVLKAIGTGFLDDAHLTEIDVHSRIAPAPWRLVEFGEVGDGQWLAAAVTDVGTDDELLITWKNDDARG